MSATWHLLLAGCEVLSAKIVEEDPRQQLKLTGHSLVSAAESLQSLMLVGSDSNPEAPCEWTSSMLVCLNVRDYFPAPAEVSLLEACRGTASAVALFLSSPGFG